MNQDIRIKMDQGTLSRSADGTLTMGGKAGCITWALLIIAALGTMGAAAGLVYGILRLGPPDSQTLDPNLYMLALAAFFGYVTFHLFRNASRGRVVIDPVTKLIRIRQREISFAQITDLATRSVTPPLMDGALVVTFYAVLADGEEVGLGSISGNEEKIDERSAQILQALGETIKPENHRHADA